MPPRTKGRIRETFVRPIVAFLQLETAGGMTLIAATIIALIVANSPLAHSYHAWLERPISVALGGSSIAKPIHFWVNNFLMTAFFFLVGLEIKREIVVGDLKDPRSAALPIAAALGGMVVPAIVYTIANAGSSTAKGWGIPMATDIAFSLGVLALLGNRIPLALKIFLAALAIVDDLGAVLVIAVFYTQDLATGPLFLGLGIFGILLALNASGVRSILPYLAAGLPMWYCIFLSGVHGTIAGVLLALTIPARVRIDSQNFLSKVKRGVHRFEEACREESSGHLSESQQTALHEVQVACRDAQMPLEVIERSLHPYVTFGVIPLFAFANAGITMSPEMIGALVSAMPLGIGFGLVLGKPLGIVTFSLLAIRLKWAVLPQGVGTRQIVGIGLLAGIGFTMSLFIADLSFGAGPQLESAKLAILIASLLAGTLGCVVLTRNSQGATSDA